MANLNLRIEQTEDMLKKSYGPGVQQQEIAFQQLKNQLEIMKTLQEVLSKLDNAKQ